MFNRYNYTILELFENVARYLKTRPLDLGGFAGSGGGEGASAAGYIGWLPQTRVAYDTDEFATLDTDGSGTLLDNLNHIRYRIETLEASSGILIVDDGNTTVNLVQQLTFSGGAVVTDLGTGHVLVTITASGGSGLDTASGDARYLKLDASNDPITGALVIDTSSGDDLAALHIIESTPDNTGLWIESVGDGAWIYASDDHDVIYLDHIVTANGVEPKESVYVYRHSDTGIAGFFNIPAIAIVDEDNTTTFSGGAFRHSKSSDSNNPLVDINPYAATVSGVMILADAQNPINSTGRLLSLKKQGTEIFSVDGNGTVNIPTGQTYNINGSPHTHSVIYPRARIYHNTTQNCTTGVFTVLTFNSERYDIGNLHSTVTNPSRITIPEDGNYTIKVNVSIDMEANKRFTVAILLNGTTIIAAATNHCIVAGGLEVNCSCDYELAANDYLEVEVWHDNSVDKNCLSSANYSPEFSIKKNA